MELCDSCDDSPPVSCLVIRSQDSAPLGLKVSRIMCFFTFSVETRLWPIAAAPTVTCSGILRWRSFGAGLVGSCNSKMGFTPATRVTERAHHQQWSRITSSGRRSLSLPPERCQGSALLEHDRFRRALGFHSGPGTVPHPAPLSGTRPGSAGGSL